MKKRIISAVLLLILTIAVSTSAFAVVAKSSEYYVDDTANVLSAAIKQKIIDSNTGPNGLEQLCDGAQVVVVTVPYLDGMTSDAYAMQLFNDWGVGSKTANNGMLLLLATGENKAWLTVGAGISNVFTDTMVNDYFNKYFWTDFDKGQYETATSNMLEALFTWYAGYYHINNSAAATPGAGNNAGNYNGSTYNNGNYNNGNGGYSDGTAPLAGSIFIWIMILVIILIVFAAAVAADRRRYRAYYTHLGMPMPVYYPWFLWVGPHRAWWYGPGGPGWRGGGPRGPGGPGGFGGGPRGGGGGFGGFGGGGGGRGGGGFGGFGGGGGGFGGGGGGFGGGGGGRR